jgi:hypothetical protein
LNCWRTRGGVAGAHRPHDHRIQAAAAAEYADLVLVRGRRRENGLGVIGRRIVVTEWRDLQVDLRRVFTRGGAEHGLHRPLRIVFVEVRVDVGERDERRRRCRGARLRCGAGMVDDRHRERGDRQADRARAHNRALRGSRSPVIHHGLPITAARRMSWL